MCGINGEYRFDGKAVDTSVIKRMNDAMIRRGPDGEGVFFDAHFAMGMRRLSIIDLEGGHQPISNEDGTIHVMQNGEIYNYLELRSELEKKGHIFKTHSDTEVILHVYEEFGLEGINKLNGMFAFSLWDQKRQRLWIARDRIGIKPLNYYLDHEKFIFSSSLDSLLATQQIAKKIDEDSFQLLLTLSYVPAPRSIYSGLKKLMPGHCIVVENNKLSTYKYWDALGVPVVNRSHEDFVSQVDSLLKESVELQSRSDVPVCCFLSGGIDSSAVTALFSLHSTKQVHSYSVGFQGKSRDESDVYYASLVAKQYKTQHHEFEMQAEQAFSLIDELMPLMDEPIADSAILPSYYLSMKTRQNGVKVILSGAGGDELYGGYFRHFKHKRDLLVGKFSFVTAATWFALASIHDSFARYGLQLHDSGVAFALATSGVDLGVLVKILSTKQIFLNSISLLKKQFAEVSQNENKLNYSYARMLTDVHQYLADNILSLFDKTSMAASTEGRVPLLDHRLVELTFSTPFLSNLAEGEYKRSLKSVVRKYLPEEILTRKKAGFNGPVQHWLSGPEGQLILRRIQSPVCHLIRDLFNIKSIENISSDRRMRFRASETLFMLYLFDKWYESHF